MNASISKGKKRDLVVKPNGRIDKQVEEVGPRRFGIVSVDCHKGSSKWMLCDFFGKVLIEPTQVMHTRNGFRKTVQQIEEQTKLSKLGKVIVVVERAGTYHELPKRVFSEAGYNTRVVHPFATKHFRQPADHSVKTDDTDLAAIHRATVVGFALVQPTLTVHQRQLQLAVRLRRDLIKKRSALKCQIREQLHGAMPGYDMLYGEYLWQSKVAIPIARHYRCAEKIHQATLGELKSYCQNLGVRASKPGLQKAKAWAQTAAVSEANGDLRWPAIELLLDDLDLKTQQIQEAEVQLATLLAGTPYILLLAVPGVNVISAAGVAGEMGDIRWYANPNAITGRAGLFPGSYQTCNTDVKNISLVRHGNKRLRNALLQLASNLLSVNHFYSRQKIIWDREKVHPKVQRTRVAKKFSRLLFSSVSSGRIIPHPCCREQDYVLNKLMTFLLKHEASWETIQRTMFAAVAQLPANRRQAEAEHLEKEQKLTQRKRGAIQKAGDIINLVVAKLLGLPTTEDNLEEQASD
jgi:transposase